MTILRVRVASCQVCEQRTFEFLSALISVLSRSVGETHAYFGCRACGEVCLRRRDVASFGCPSCGHRWSTSRAASGCAHCKHEQLLFATWHSVLVQELYWLGEQPRARLRLVAADDPVALDDVSEVPNALSEAIPNGLETKRLLANGFRVWADLYSGRQITVLNRALQAVQTLNASQAVRDRPAFAALGAARCPLCLAAGTASI